MHKLKRALLGAVVVTTAMAGFTPMPALAATLTVGNPTTCPGATYPTINSAVTAAMPGDTIRVCAGTYIENVLVYKPNLTFLGAQAGHDARFRHSSPSAESTVAFPAGDFTLTALASNTMIDGFTITGAAPKGPLAANAYGILSIQGSSGLVVVNNIIKDNEEGINYQNPSGSLASRIQRNAFNNNSAGLPAQPAESGTGVFISNGPANSTTISDNTFTGHKETAINFAGNPASRSVGLVVTRNLSVDDSTFVVATDSDGAVISRNAVFVRAAAPNGTGILDFGNNRNLLIDANVINGGATPPTSGIRVGNFTGFPAMASTGTKVSNNRVSNRFNGIRISETSGATVSANAVSGSVNDGILAEPTAPGNSFFNNRVRTSAVHDCEDRTGAVANVWAGNVGSSNNSVPREICPSKDGQGGGDGNGNGNDSGDGNGNGNGD